MALPAGIRVLLLADTHLGFDLPFRPRIKRRRRGPDFFANFERALKPALEGRVDLVVHGGDLLFRSKVPEALVEMAMAPLKRVADKDVPVYLVPGNHERAKIPGYLWTLHPNIHIFNKPRTFLFSNPYARVALAGMPFSRNIHDCFQSLLLQTGYQRPAADLRLLCLHQSIEGARVGPADYTFRSDREVLPGRRIPADVDAVLCGHIHRAQMLTRDLRGFPLGAPVIYPGSIERTSFAERDEAKRYAIVTLNPGEGLDHIQFIPLPTRPMLDLHLSVGGRSRDRLLLELKKRLERLHPDAIVRLKLDGPGSQHAAGWLAAKELRRISPPGMTVNLALTRRIKPRDTE